MTSTKKPYYTTHEFAEVFGIGLSGAYKLVNSKGFYPAFRIGKRILISADALERWVSEQTTKA